MYSKADRSDSVTSNVVDSVVGKFSRGVDVANGSNASCRLSESPFFVVVERIASSGDVFHDWYTSGVNGMLSMVSLKAGTDSIFGTPDASKSSNGLTTLTTVSTTDWVGGLETRLA